MFIASRSNSAQIFIRFRQCIEILNYISWQSFCGHPHTIQDPESTSRPFWTTLIASDMVAVFPTFLICTCLATPGVAQCRFLLNLVNTLQIWTKTHGTHFLALELRLQSRPDDFNLSENFDCMIHGRGLSNCFACACLSALGVARTTPFLDFVYTLQGGEKLSDIHIWNTHIRFRPRMDVIPFSDNFDCKCSGRNLSDLLFFAHLHQILE